MNSRASKNLAQSKGKSIGRLIVGAGKAVVGGLKRIGKAYARNHKITQERIDRYGTSVIFK